MEFNIPKEVLDVISELKKAQYKAYVVGGPVRDMLLGRVSKNWDVATDAKPEEIQKIFPESVYENQFGTVGVKTQSENPYLKIIEVTTFRLEGKYTDKRHPDEIRFAKTIDDDLKRRDFTVNAMALDVESNKILDPFDGEGDLKKKILRAVGEPKERFEEDALRMMRAVRFSAELGFKIDEETGKAIKDSAGLLEFIAKERIRDEFVKIIMSDNKGPMRGVTELEELGLLRFVVPELREGIGTGQNKHHIYTIWEHNLLSLDYAAKQNYSFEVRLASLLHDVGKPRVKEGDGVDSTFYAHEIVGGKMTVQILDRLHFPKETIEKVAHLVRFHLFYYNVGEVTEAGVRRFLRRVGPENVDDLLRVREADRIGSGVPKAVPYKTRHLRFMLEKVAKDPVSPKMLKVNGNEVMKILGVGAGPRIGAIIAVLLEEVLDSPQKNTAEYLESRIKGLGGLSDDELKILGEKAKGKKEEFEIGIEEEIKRKYYVK
ncbi:MAG: HD domain-containing protein [Candidatus Colwellbacteria bacterium]|nr:HD domain-containing protein [Candidatus Colwellbacteria bacterium]